MSTVVKCPSCAASIKAPEEIIGKQIRCPKCGKSVRVGITAVRNAATSGAEVVSVEDTADSATAKKSGFPLWLLAVIIPSVVLFCFGGVGGVAWWRIRSIGNKTESESVSVQQQSQTRTIEDAPRPSKDAPRPSKEETQKTGESRQPVQAVIAQEYKLGEQVKVGDLLITIPEVRSDQFAGQYYGSFTPIKLMLVKLSIENTSKGKIVDWIGWHGKGEVEDEHGNKFKPVRLSGWANLPNNGLPPIFTGDRGTRIAPGKTYTEALFFEYAPPTSKYVTITLPLDDKQLKFRGPIGSKEELDRIKALKAKEGTVLDAGDLFKDIRSDEGVIKSNYPIGCTMRCTGVVRSKSDQTKTRSDLKGAPYMIHVTYEPNKAMNTDDCTICFTKDKSLYERLEVGETVTLQGTLKFIPQRRERPSRVQAHIYDCVEPNAEQAAAEREKRRAEKAKRQIEMAQKEREEAKAQSALRAALQLAGRGFKKEARKRYQEIVEKYPETKAAATAKNQLEKP